MQEEGGTAHGLIQRLTVVAMRICNYSELEELGQDRLISLLGILYTRMEQLRISSSACSISWTGASSIL